MGHPYFRVFCLCTVVRSGYYDLWWPFHKRYVAKLFQDFKNILDFLKSLICRFLFFIESSLKTIESFCPLGSCRGDNVVQLTENTLTLIIVWHHASLFQVPTFDSESMSHHHIRAYTRCLGLNVNTWKAVFEYIGSKTYGQKNIGKILMSNFPNIFNPLKTWGLSSHFMSEYLGKRTTTVPVRKFSEKKRTTKVQPLYHLY